MPTPTAELVPRQTSEAARRRIERRLAMRVGYHAMRPGEIDARLAELDREWHVDRTLQANAATLSLVGILLGAALDRRWFLLLAAVAGFLLQHALQGWCPPLPVLRRIGVRTAEEIAQERYALKALRGDFEGVSAGGPGRPARVTAGGPGTEAAPFADPRRLASRGDDPVRGRARPVRLIC
jgi:hypothetical protein